MKLIDIHQFPCPHLVDFTVINECCKEHALMYPHMQWNKVHTRMLQPTQNENCRFSCDIHEDYHMSQSSCAMGVE